jgi:hypothetical protein
MLARESMAVRTLKCTGDERIAREENGMAETLLQYQKPVLAPDGTRYEARACGEPQRGGTWQGWLEFVPITGGTPIRTARETTQPNRADTVYWATGVSAVYLEGALRRALMPPVEVTPLPKQPAIFNDPAPSPVVPVENETTAVLDPFSVYAKGEALLRNQLGALSAWHLVNIAVAYELTTGTRSDLNRLPAAALVEMIVSAVRSARQ